jgi:D-alanyl-D-alanine dipeptidase
MKRILFLLICFASTSAGCLNLNMHKQLVLVIADDWGCNEARMWRCSRKSARSSWEVSEDNFHVRLSPKGLAWGRGLHPRQNLIGPKKKEEDKRTPAGIFAIGPVMGFKPKEDINPLKMPYIHITPSLIAINDIQSSYYNQIVDSKFIQGDWQSSINISECKCCKWGAIIEYNFHPSIPKEGSCTFLFEDTDDPRTFEYAYSALYHEDLMQLLYWLQQSDNPLIVQLTKSDYLKFKDPWKLPDLKWIK